MKIHAILIVGATGTGKTSQTKNILKADKRPKFIYDINQEYRNFYSGKYVTQKEFLKSAVKLKNSTIIFEEATIFFSNKSSNLEMRELLVRKRHTNNLIILNFHSLRTVPVYIWDLIDVLILFKTLDNFNLISRKLDGNVDVIRAFVELSDNPNQHAKKILNLR